MGRRRPRRGSRRSCCQVAMTSRRGTADAERLGRRCRDDEGGARGRLARGCGPRQRGSYRGRPRPRQRPLELRRRAPATAPRQRPGRQLDPGREAVVALIERQRHRRQAGSVDDAVYGVNGPRAAEVVPLIRAAPVDLAGLQRRGRERRRQARCRRRQEDDDRAREALEPARAPTMSMIVSCAGALLQQPRQRLDVLRGRLAAAEPARLRRRRTRPPGRTRG